jgi:hypothetical protein
MMYHIAFLLAGVGAGACTALAIGCIHPRDLDPL